MGVWVEHGWNDVDEGKLKYSKKSLSLYHFVHHISQGIEPGCTL
jgi:hypothetical protein